MYDISRLKLEKLMDAVELADKRRLKYLKEENGGEVKEVLKIIINS